MSQGQSKEEEHLINMHGSRLSSLSPHRAMMPASFLLCHIFNSFFRLWIKSIWNQWGTFCSFRRALDQVWRRKCRSGSTNLSCISFYFLFPLFALISEGNMLYSICSQAVLGCEPPEPGTVVIGLSDQQGTVFLLFSWLPPTRYSFHFSLCDTAKECIWHHIASVLWDEPQMLTCFSAHKHFSCLYL